MRSWLAGVSFACALGCATGLAQSPDSAAMKERLDAVAKSYAADHELISTSSFGCRLCNLRFWCGRVRLRRRVEA
jgi:hypothetical protein